MGRSSDTCWNTGMMAASSCSSRRSACASVAVTLKWCSLGNTCRCEPSAPRPITSWPLRGSIPSGTLVAIVPRLVASLTADGRPWPLGESTWTSTRILLPEALQATQYRHLITGNTVDLKVGPEPFLAASGVLSTCPVALLWAHRSPLRSRLRRPSPNGNQTLDPLDMVRTRRIAELSSYCYHARARLWKK